MDFDTHSTGDKMDLPQNCIAIQFCPLNFATNRRQIRNEGNDIKMGATMNKSKPTNKKKN